MGCSGTKEIKQESEVRTTTRINEIIVQPMTVEPNEMERAETPVKESPVCMNIGAKEEEVNFDLDNVLNDINNNLKEEDLQQIEVPQKVEEHKEEDKKIVVKKIQKNPVDEIVSRIGIVLNETEITNVMILKQRSLRANKDYFECFETTDETKVSLLKTEAIEWSRKPYCDAISRIEELFTEPEYKKYNGIDFDIKQLEYEYFFINLNLKAGSTFENVKIKTGEPFIMFFFNYNDFDSYIKIHDLIGVNVHVYLIYNEFITSQKDALGTLDICQNVLGIQTEVYFIEKKERNIKYFDITKPCCVCVDGDGVIKYIGSPKELYAIDLLKPYQGPHIAEAIKAYIEKFNNGIPLHIKVDLKQAEVYDLNGELVREYIEPPHIMFDTLDDKQTRGNQELFLSKFPSEIYSVNNIQHLALNIEIIINELEKIKALHDGIEHMKYSILVKNKKTYHKQLQYYKTSEKEVCITFHVNTDNFNEHLSITEGLGYIKAHPNIPKIYSISLVPDIDTQLPNQINLAEDTLYLSDEKPKFIILFGYSTIIDERLALVRRLQKIWDVLKNYTDGIEIILLFRGESINEANELLQEEIFNSYINVRVIQDTSPLLIQFESNNDFYCMILDSENYVKYVGITRDLNLENTLEALTVGKNEICNIQETWSNEELKTDIKSFLSHFSSLEADFVYNPLFELRTTEVLEFDKQNVAKKFLPPSLKIVTKKFDEEEKLLQDKKALIFFKKLKNQYEGNVILDFVRCIKIPELRNCIKCNKKGRFYNQVDDCFYCYSCEMIGNRQDNPLETNLVLIQPGNKVITNEVIEDLYNQNIRSENYAIENINDPYCTLCNGNLTGAMCAWMSLIHIGDPVLLCNQCINLILDKNSSCLDETKKKIKHLGLTSENGFVIRKMLLQSSI
jgi:hypothetical protein